MGAVVLVAILLGSVLPIVPLPAVVPAAEATTTFYVGPGDGTDPAGEDCELANYLTTNYASADAAISAAMSDAPDDAVVHICAGTYDLEGTVAVTTDNFSDAVTIEGDTSTNTILRRSPAKVDGDAVFTLLDSARPLTIASLTMRDASTFSGGTLYGGAVRAHASLTVSDAQFRANDAVTGGAIYAFGTILVEGSLFADNTSATDTGGGDGGAIRAVGAITVRDSRFESNTGSWGGAISGVASVAIARSSFVGNASRAIGPGGAIEAAGTLSVTDATFIDNIADSEGGAIRALGTTRIEGSTFIGNSAYSGGAIVFRPLGGAATLDLRNSTFAENLAGYGGGGALRVYPDTTNPVRVVTSTFVDNSSGGLGGAIRAEYRLEVTASTFVDNGAMQFLNGAAGHVWSDQLSPTVFRAVDSIFAATVPGVGGCGGPVITGTHNLTTDASCPGDVTTATALALLPLAENGGPAPTMELLAGSRAIDGAGSSCTTATDQRGRTRGVDGGCDVGAYEWSAMRYAGDGVTASVNPACAAPDFDTRYVASADRAIEVGANRATTTTLHLCAGTYAFTGTAVVSRTSPLRIEGDSTTATIVSRAAGAVDFPLLRLGNGFSADITTGIVGVTFRNARNEGPGGIGGAIYVPASNTARLTISGSAFEDCRAVLGGAIYSAAAPLTLTDGTSFVANRSSSDGGAVWTSGSLTIAGSVFTGNIASGAGGAIAKSGNLAMTIAGGTFRGNNAGTIGGAIRSSSALTSVGVAYLENTSGTVGSGDRRGGGIYASAVVSSTNDRFERNRARPYGTASEGGAILAEATISVSSGTFIDNIADTGGAIATYTSGTVADSSFSGNRATGGNPRGYGGALLINATAGDLLTVLRSDFTRNVGGNWGGAVGTLNAARLSLTDTSFTGNQAVKGGGVYNSGNLTGVRVRFVDNTAGEGGGIIGAANTNIGISDGSFIRNVAPGGGGSIMTRGFYGSAKVSVTDGTFVENRASLDGASGGAILSDYVVIERGSFSANRAANGGAIRGLNGVRVVGATFSDNISAFGGALEGSSIAVTDGTFTDNSAGVYFSNSGGQGGAIEAGTVRSERSTYLRNRATQGWWSSSGRGGAIYAGSLISINDTFAWNRAEQSGGSVWVNSPGTGSGFRYDTFIDNTAGSSGDAIYHPGTPVAVTASIFAGGTCAGLSADAASFRTDAGCPGSLVARADLKLDDLSATPGSRPVFRLLAGSVAIDPTSGSLSECTWTGGSASLDGRGLPRPALHGCDAGAVEFQGPADRVTGVEISGSSGDRLLTGGVKVKTGSSVTLSATVLSNPASGPDMTGGVVRFFACSSAVAIPTDCSAGTVGRVQVGSDQALDPGTPNDGRSTSLLTAWQPATGLFYRVAAAYLIPGGVILGSDSTSGQAAFRVADFTTFTTLAARTGGSDLTGGSITTADLVAVTATVASADFSPVGVGTVTLRYCRSDVAVPVSCTAGAGTDLTAGIMVTDGTAGVTAWLPPLPGYYRLAASYSSGDAAILGSDLTTGNATFQVLRPVTLRWDATTGLVAAGASVTLRAQVFRTGTTDPTSGCRVTFAVSDGTSFASAEATSGIDGYASATIAGGLATGVHLVTMTAGGPCGSPRPAWGVISAGPTSGFSRATTGVFGGGWYFREGSSGTRISFGMRVEVTTGTVNRATVTYSKIALVVVSDDGWILETRATDTTTATAAAPWLRETCPTSLSDGISASIANVKSNICGRVIYSAPSVRQWVAGAWQSSGARLYTLKVADGGVSRTGDPTDWIGVTSIRNLNGTDASASFPGLISRGLRPLRGGAGYATNPYRGSLIIL